MAIDAVVMRFTLVAPHDARVSPEAGFGTLIARSMKRFRCILLASLVALGLVAAPALPLRAGNLWQPPAVTAADQAYERHMVRGDSYAIRAVEARSMRVIQKPGRWQPPELLALRAVDAYEEAAAARPEAAEPHYRAAEVLNAHFLEQIGAAAVIGDRAIAERALGHWRAFEERAPLDPRATDTLFRRAIINTRLATDADLARAIDNYELLIARSDLPSRYGSNVAIWLSNLAETYMMAGRLDDAVRMYRRALDHGNDALHGYGLAVALDRNDQGALAREVMMSYALADKLRALETEGIFFVPEGEKEYYLALGREALGELAQAAAHYRRFIRSGAHPRFRPRAVDNLRAVEDRLRGRSGRAGGPGR